VAAKIFTTAQKLVLLGLVQMLFVFTVFIESVAGMQQAPVYQAAQVSKEFDKNVVAYQIRMPSFSVYRQQITPKDDPQVGDLVFTKVGKLSSLQESLPNADLHTVFAQGGILLIDVQERKPMQ
jgi:hypothetical protein